MITLQDAKKFFYFHYRLQLSNYESASEKYKIFYPRYKEAQILVPTVGIEIKNSGL